ncbi:uncharacterized protein LOC124396030 [Silurus meridionalis]|uniref:uncharacterized protein LOC124396030 n=1 Tax=Silurus meridionalis TaxID=175797 RepID=UPI001EEC817F|nr:uncharacterized protein LOC124396030 [Silurus meridionalis]
MIVSMETDGSFSESPKLTLLQSNDGVGSGLVEPEEEWLGFRATVSAVLFLEFLLGVGGNLTVLVLYCGHCNLLESVSHAVTLSLHTLDLLLCLLCLPITAILLLLGGTSSPHHVLLCCLHESAATFASVGTALNLLLISLDRYDISVRPANRLLTPRRAAFLLAGVWVVSLTLPVLPFVEAGLGSETTDGAPVYSNSTLLCSQLVGTLQAHLFLQAPIFLCSLAVMLYTYSRILRALRIRIGHPARVQKGTTQLVQRPWQCRNRSARSPDHIAKTVSASPPPLSTGPLVASDTITTVTMNTETNTPSVNTPLSPTPTTSTATTPFSLTSNVGLSSGAIPLNPISTLSTLTTTLNQNPNASTFDTHLYPNISTITTHQKHTSNTSSIITHLNPNPNTSTISFPLNHNLAESTTTTYQNSNPIHPHNHPYKLQPHNIQYIFLFEPYADYIHHICVSKFQSIYFHLNYHFKPCPSGIHYNTTSKLQFLKIHHTLTSKLQPLYIHHYPTSKPQPLHIHQPPTYKPRSLHHNHTS